MASNPSDAGDAVSARTALPALRRTARKVFAELQERKGLDADWRGGRLFGLVYPTGRADIDEVLVDANDAYVFENALNPQRFPSVAWMQREVLSMVSSLVNAPAGAGAGFTAGGTESILMSVLVSRERARAERGVERANLVVPMSAHPAFAKAAFYFGLDVRTTPLTSAFTADLSAVRDAVDERTALIVGSAYSYPHGVMDPIEELSGFAQSKGIPFHSDTCIGAFVLPFLERLGHEVPPYDFRLPGVTQMSCDVHKYGYSTKGASAVVYRDAAWLKHQVFDYDAWPSGRYRTASIAGARAASPIAAAWAVMTYLGEAGYTELMGELMTTTKALRSGIEVLEGLQILGAPIGPLVSFTSTTNDAFAIGDAMDERGWHLNRVQGPRGLHMMISPLHGSHVEAFLDDLAGAVVAPRGESADVGATYS